MIIYKNIDSVWINTTDGVTVYFSYNHLAGHMMGYVNTPCGVSQHQHFGKCESIEDGRKQLSELTSKDADMIFGKILEWDHNKNYGIENFQMVSCTEPIQQNTTR